jgi:hypothetical protein
LTTIASTADEFNFFGFDTSISNIGEVAFKAELDEEFGFEEGLFSGFGRAVTTHYLASTSDFGGNDSRPAITTSARYHHLGWTRGVDKVLLSDLHTRTTGALLKAMASRGRMSPRSNIWSSDRPRFLSVWGSKSLTRLM